MSPVVVTGFAGMWAPEVMWAWGPGRALWAQTKSPETDRDGRHWERARAVPMLVSRARRVGTLS